MNRILLAALPVLLLSSCMNYQYLTVASSGTEKNEKDEYFIENDSLKLVYNFSGLNGPINLTIYNKLDEPLYIDWKRSALIVNDKAISYVATTVPFQGSFNSGSYTWSELNPSVSTYGSFSGSAKLPEYVDFIPPHAYIAKQPMGLTNYYAEYANDSVYKKEYVQITDGTTRRVKVKRFSKENSPLVFKSYVTLYSGKENDQPVIFQHQFYISELYKTALGPNNFRFINDKKGNRFYVSSVSGAGKTIGVGILAGVALVSVAALHNGQGGTGQ